MIDNVVVPVATLYDLAKEYEYLKYSINGYLTGFVYLLYCIIMLCFFMGLVTFHLCIYSSQTSTSLKASNLKHLYHLSELFFCR